MDKYVELIKAKDIGDKSKKVYLSILSRLFKEGMKFPTKKAEKEKYVKEFLTKFEKPATRLDLLNVIIILRTEMQLPTDKLKELRSEIRSDRQTKNIDTMNELGKTLPTLPEFEGKMDEAFSDGDYRKYAVNYLMKELGVRNMDVDVTISKTKKDVEDGKNYLVIQPKKIIYIRDSYKTHKKYGKQVHNITDDKFMKSIKKIGVGKMLEGGLQNALRKLQIDKLKESDIFKMIIDDAYEKKDTERINELSKTRGSSIPTIKGNYNVNAEKEIIREI